MILDRLFRARRPTATPPPTLTDLSLLTPMADTLAGINQYSALQSSAVYACIRILSETLAQLPLVIRRRTADGSELARSHPMYAIIGATPNPWMTSFTWRNTSQGHCVSWGNGYSYIIRNQKGEPRAILPLLPDRTYPQVTDNRLSYWTQVGDQTVEAAPQDVIHIQALGHDGLVGMSPIALQREAIGLNQAAQSFGAKLFANGSLLSGVLTHPGRLRRKADKPDDPSPVERLRRQWRELYSGLENAGQVAVLEEGMNFQSIGIPPEDAQFLQTRKFQVADICRIFNVPAHLVNDLDRATFNNISELSISFLRYTMTPWIVRWEQELNRKLFPGSDTYYVKFNMAGLLRGTLAERADYYKTAIEYGWLSRNEVREMEDLNQVDGLDEYLQPLNMGSGQNSDPSDPPDGDTHDDTQTPA
ncbi:MAG: phage portal protein [Candidatus Thiodiazotropha sp. 6PLUC6]